MKQFYKIMFIIFLLTLTSNKSYSQLMVDTITFEPILKGNTILYGSSKIGWCKVLGYDLVAFYSDGCNPEHITAEKEEIADVESKDSTLIIRIAIESNCGHSFLGEIEFVEDSILNINSHSYGIKELCECNFCLTYKINYSPERIKKIYQPATGYLKFIMINRNRSTLKNIQSLLIKK